ncbi:MAG: nucleotidyl transferase AbiEii/AbiGii toxin family protein [Chloroflexi bacterium]|nr:nucleotidyl transferase AbiEii/AbiGii toxin family protein [Chloroflexota bacterium]
MTAFATLAEDERRAYITQAGAELGILPVLVEKDFWVCWMLARIFELPDIGPHVVFKGGTSLSKVFKAIRRFSEDIDLQISCSVLGLEEASFWEEGISGSESQRRIAGLKKKATEFIQSAFTPALERGVVAALGPPAGRGTWLEYENDESANSDVVWFTYPSALREESGYVRKAVMLEPGTLVDQRPIGTHTIEPMLAEIAVDSFEDFRTEVVALQFERTFWEKATILHVEHHRKSGANVGDRRSRHYSDFAALWRHDLRPAAAADLGMLDAVVRHKKLFFKSAWASYDTAMPPTLKLVPRDDRLGDLAADYDLMEDFFFEKPPSFDEVIRTLREAENEINGA